MDLGRFSVSLAVKDLQASLSFYQTFGFEVIGGDSEHYVILKNQGCKLGLFQGMFEDNILTFQPQDVRAIQTALKDQGIDLEQEADSGTGPASAMLRDPDGNIILLDQF